MILNWMFASAVFAALVAVAAFLADRALAAAGRQRRGVWALGLAVSAAWPLIAGAWFLLRPVEEPIAIIRTRIGSTAARALSEQLAVAPAWGPVVARALLVAWAVISLALLVRLIMALVRMRRVVRTSEPVTIDGTPVLLSDYSGPAVCGPLNPRIVLPRWILELDAPLRAYVLSHEREHVARGDAATVLGAAIGVALVPWSPAVWIMSRRLRLAVELDCDARVLAGCESSDRYGRLLVLVAQRQSHARLQPMLAESSAHLERRISEMNAPRSRRPALRAVLLGAAAAAAVLLAFSSPVMAGIIKPPPAPPKFGTEVLQLPTVKTTASAPRTPTYRLSIVDESLHKRGPEIGRVRAIFPRTQGQGRAQTPPPPPPRKESVEFTISQQAQQAPNSAYPRYPDILKQAGVEGSVTVQFVVNADSTIMEGSMKVLNSSHQLFTESVRNALSQMRYVAAQVKGRPVRQLIEQQFEFRIAEVAVTGAQEGVPGSPGATVFKPKTVVITGSVSVKKP